MKSKGYSLRSDNKNRIGGQVTMYRFNSFTGKANEVLNLAIKAAENYGHNYIGSEHILYGLLKEGFRPCRPGLLFRSDY